MKKDSGIWPIRIKNISSIQVIFPSLTPVTRIAVSRLTGGRLIIDLSELIGWSKYHLLRSFTKQKGITPNSYLETIRINQAKKLLEQGVRPIDAAFQTGFSDQSHMTKFFKRQVGLTPKQYMKIFEKELQR